MRTTYRHWMLLFGAVALGLPGRASAQQPDTISGLVTSEVGQPLSYVEVTIPALDLSVFTRENGRYVLIIPGARVTGQRVELLARRLGYKEKSVLVTLTAGALAQDFSLAPNPLKLGEIVATGAGTVTETEKLASVINHVDSTQIHGSDEMNVVQALAGKAPNVEVVSQGGDPGASSFIRIRGPNTLLGSEQPLLVVDGMPIDNSTTITGGNGNNVASTIASNRAADINPSDIASIEILKGASAAAIYGARAGQGVVLITTKSGHAGPTRTTFSSQLLVNHVTQGVPLQTTYGQGSEGVAPTCSARGCSLTSSSWGPKLATGTPVFDHFGELFQNGYTTDNNLTVSGGNDNTLFYLSGEYMYNRGDIVGPNDNYQRAAVRLKASQRLSDAFKLTGNVSVADSRGDYLERGSNVSGLLLGAMRTPPDFNNLVYLDSATGLQRSYRYPLPPFGSATTSRGYDNPFFVINKDAANSRVGRAYGDVNASYLATSWLQLSDELGLDYSTDERLEALAQSSSSFPLGQVTSADYKHLQLDNNLVATATYSVSPTFGGTVTLGQELNSRSERQIEVVGNGLIAPGPFSLSNTVDRSPPDNTILLVHTASFFGQVTTDLFNQLYLTAGIRNDGSSTFGSANRFNWFPKASIAWEFTKYLNEPRSVFRFLQGPLSILSYGKARLAYGQTGREPDAYQTINSFTTAALGDNGWGPSLTPTQNGRGGIYSGTVKGQQNLKPERTKEFEGGVDLGFFHDRSDAHFTYYNRTSSDVIFLAPLAPSSGYQFQAQNAATINDVGYELSWNFRPIQTARAAWDIGLQWATDNDLVTQLKGAQFVLLPNSGFTDPQGAAIVGYPVGELRGTDFVRCGRGIIDPTYGNIDAQCGNAPAGAIYLAPNGKPIEDQSLRPIANPLPKWTGSVSSAFQYKKWRLSGLLDIKHGGQMWNGTRGALTFFGTAANTLNRGQTLVFGKTFYPQFTFAGPGVGVPVLINQDNWYQGDIGSGFTGPSAQFVENAGFVKLREIAVSYTFDGQWVKNLGLDAIDLRVSGRNLKTWTKYTGIDPESNLLGADVGQQGFDYFNTPQTRSFAVSITLHR
jgi:TonB-linked SusC/RagA family outer membrane protein